MTDESPQSADAPTPFRILSLDGGGAKGFYSLGVLREIEALAGKRLHEVFDLIFGTSTGAIIASLLALGRSVEEIHALYVEHVVKIMSRQSSADKTAALNTLAREVYADTKFESMRTGVGIVTTKWDIERPMIFKGQPAQAHGRRGTFVPGFGVPVGEAVVASCSAYPFFKRKILTTAAGDRVELVDGGYCANNPTLYAIADALGSLAQPRSAVRVVSVGVGTYPEPKPAFFSKMAFASRLLSVQLLQKTLEINTQSMDQLREILYSDIHTVRISDTFANPEMATDLFEHDLNKLNLLRQRGAESFAKNEAALTTLLT
ncbi:patatin-like phospholipase [Komagataeibacter europaeus]|uniref:Patatin-like phospholipase n=1 Tax=Komagataeibacter europaeus TaxID=33995 RepID=A0A0M0EE58_KOMEU|nr:patatin-like phospholipase family protein [Komagataeibacter europaeus]KON63241.1 patatin-like phospholipase [Komagataeibacter europaeus]